MPLLVITDETGKSQAALPQEGQLTPTTSQETSVIARRKSQGKTKCAPSSEEIEEFYAMAMSTASNADEFVSPSSFSGNARGRRASLV